MNAWQMFLHPSQLATCHAAKLLSAAECDAVRADRDFWIVRDFPLGEAPLPVRLRLVRPMPRAPE